MAFCWSKYHPQGFNQAFDAALREVVEDPEQLSLRIDQLTLRWQVLGYIDPPLPDPSSGDTLQLVIPIEKLSGKLLQSMRREKLNSYPYDRFQKQARRERKRIIYQVENERFGRKQTLPFDETADWQASAENNIRAHWVEQGIWKEEWGSAWPKGAKIRDCLFRSTNIGPKLNSTNIGPKIRSLRWGHETRPEPNTATEESGCASAQDVTEAPAATSERETSASRPYHQFLSQVSREREWIRDEVQFLEYTGEIDIDSLAHESTKKNWIDSLAYESTKKNWIEDKVWNPTWGELPGMTWMHEALEEELNPIAGSNNKQTPRLPHLHSLRPLDPEPTPRVYNNSTNSPRGGGPFGRTSEPTQSAYNTGTNRNNLFGVPMTAAEEDIISRRKVSEKFWTREVVENGQVFMDIFTECEYTEDELEFMKEFRGVIDIKKVGEAVDRPGSIRYRMTLGSPGHTICIPPPRNGVSGRIRRPGFGEGMPGFGEGMPGFGEGIPGFGESGCVRPRGRNRAN